jgi:hypothetical protein
MLCRLFEAAAGSGFSMTRFYLFGVIHLGLFIWAYSFGLISLGLMIEEIPTLLEGRCEKIRKQSCCHMIAIAVSCFYPLTCQTWRKNCFCCPAVAKGFTVN